MAPFANLRACCHGEHDNGDRMALSDCGEMCNCMITAGGGGTAEV